MQGRRLVYITSLTYSCVMAIFLKCTQTNTLCVHNVYALTFSLPMINLLLLKSALINSNKLITLLPKNMYEKSYFVWIKISTTTTKPRKYSLQTNIMSLKGTRKCAISLFDMHLDWMLDVMCLLQNGPVF